VLGCCLMLVFDMKNMRQTTKCSALIHRASFATSVWQRDCGFSGGLRFVT